MSDHLVFETVASIRDTLECEPQLCSFGIASRTVEGPEGTIAVRDDVVAFRDVRLPDAVLVAFARPQDASNPHGFVWNHGQLASAGLERASNPHGFVWNAEEGADLSLFPNPLQTLMGSSGTGDIPSSASRSSGLQTLMGSSGTVAVERIAVIMEPASNPHGFVWNLRQGRRRPTSERQLQTLMGSSGT